MSFLSPSFQSSQGHGIFFFAPRLFFTLYSPLFSLLINSGGLEGATSLDYFLLLGGIEVLGAIWVPQTSSSDNPVIVSG